MLRVPVSKQGRLQTVIYDDRIATVDPDQHCLFLSRKKKPSDLCHHKLIVQEVRLWPAFPERAVREAFNSQEAILTFQVRGTEVRATRDDAERATQATDSHQHASPSGKSQTLPVVAPPEHLRELTADDRSESDPEGGADEALSPHNGSQILSPPPQLHAEESTRTNNAADEDATMAIGNRDDDTMPKNQAHDTGFLNTLSSVMLRDTKREWILRCPSLEVLEQMVASFQAMHSPSQLPTVMEHTRHEDCFCFDEYPHVVGDLDKIQHQHQLLEQGVRAKKKPPKGELLI